MMTAEIIHMMFQKGLNQLDFLVVEALDLAEYAKMNYKLDMDTNTQGNLKIYSSICQYY